MLRMSKVYLHSPNTPYRSRQGQLCLQWFDSVETFKQSFNAPRNSTSFMDTRCSSLHSHKYYRILVWASWIQRLQTNPLYLQSTLFFSSSFKMGFPRRYFPWHSCMEQSSWQCNSPDLTEDFVYFRLHVHATNPTHLTLKHLVTSICSCSGQSISFYAFILNNCYLKPAHNVQQAFGHRKTLIYICLLTLDTWQYSHIQ
jgi:hypothetical protein